MGWCCLSRRYRPNFVSQIARNSPKPRPKSREISALRCAQIAPKSREISVLTQLLYQKNRSHGDEPKWSSFCAELSIFHARPVAGDHTGPMANGIDEETTQIASSEIPVSGHPDRRNAGCISRKLHGGCPCPVPLRSGAQSGPSAPPQALCAASRVSIGLTVEGYDALKRLKLTGVASASIPGGKSHCSTVLHCFAPHSAICRRSKASTVVQVGQV